MGVTSSIAGRSRNRPVENLLSSLRAESASFPEPLDHGIGVRIPACKRILRSADSRASFSQRAALRAALGTANDNRGQRRPRAGPAPSSPMVKLSKHLEQIRHTPAKHLQLTLAGDPCGLVDGNLPDAEPLLGRTHG